MENPRARLTSIFFLLVFHLLTFYAAGSVRDFHVSPDSLTPRALKAALSQDVKGYKIGVALSGGGARGFAHLGVLEELEKNGVQADVVAGTSMGGIIGGLYATGLPLGEIERMALAIDWSTFFSDKPKRGSLLFTRRAETEGELLTLRFNDLIPQIPTALSSGQKLVNMLNSLTLTSSYFSKGNFANLDRKLALVATDIVTGEKVVFREGSLVDAIRATMGVPLAFTPLEQEGRLLMDGGLLEPIPSEAARNLGADFVIAVNTTSDLLPMEEITDPIDIANQTTTILSAQAREQLLQQADFVITPDLTGIKATDFQKVELAIARGREAVAAHLTQLKSLLEPAADSGETVMIDSVILSGDLALFDTVTAVQVSAAALTALARRKVNSTEIDAAIFSLFKTGEFQEVKYDLLTGVDGSVSLLVKARGLPRIRKAEFQGNQLYDDTALIRAGGFSGSPVSSPRLLTEAYNSIITFYRNRGYDLAQITASRLDSVSGELDIVIDEGRIAGVTVEGNAKTRWWVVTSYFPLHPGDFYSKFKALDGVQNIFACGLYDNVNLRLEERAGGAWLTISVKEKKFTFARLGARYHEEFHPEAFTKLGYANLFGIGNEVSAYGKFSERRKLFQLQLQADRLVRTFVTYSLKLYYTNNKIGVFDAAERVADRTDKHWGMKLSIGQQLWKRGLFDVTGRYEQVRMQLPGEDSSPERRVGSLQFNVNYDTKDRFTFPTSGRALKASLEVASDVLGTDEVFRKFEGFVEAYQAIGRRLNLHPRVALGLSQDGLPLYDKFYLGGSRSFYGYAVDQLVGDKYFLSNFELRIGPIFSFYLSGRYDAGEVFGRLEEVRLKQLRHAFGFTLSLDTPLGPFSVGYGRAEDKYDKLYLNLGFDF